jgi:transcription initiation factor TFIID subunit 7
MKLKLSTKPKTDAEGAPSSATPANEASTPTPLTAGPRKLTFKFGSSSAAAPAESQPAETPKPKRKYTKKPKVDEDGNPITAAAKPKKRARDENEDGTPATKRKIKPTAKSLELAHDDDDDEDELAAEPPPVPVRPSRPVMNRAGSKIKLKMKSNVGPGTLQRTNTAMIKIKGVHGKPPVRPPGVGYDSEAEEAEEDPAIESQFILRMQPGPDCDTLRKAIEEKKIGTSTGTGGTNVMFRFFDKEGRRATITINGRMYAACMLDLPCVIESMKSWNKKDWVKTADVCQMLLVLGRVQSEEEAKKFALPKEVDHIKHKYPHGLTPPMHYVRKRRFRYRQDHHEFEERERKVNALLHADDLAKSSGGNVDWQIIDSDQDDVSGGSSDEDAEGEEDDDIQETTEGGYVIEGETPGGEAVEFEAADENDIADMIAAGMMEDEDVDVEGLFGGGQVEVETPATSHDVAMHALGENPGGPITETAASTPAATSPDDDDDDDDEADSPGDDVVDEEATAAQDQRESTMAEIRELEQEIANVRAQHNAQTNVLMKRRQKQKMDQLQGDLDLKRAALGIEDGD